MQQIIKNIFLASIIFIISCSPIFGEQHEMFSAQNKSTVADSEPPGDFDPSDLAGLSLWIDVQVTSSINAGSPTNGDRVSTINGQSTNAYVFSQAVNDTRPVYTTGGQNSRSYLECVSRPCNLNTTANHTSGINPFGGVDTFYCWAVLEHRNLGSTHFQWSTSNPDRLNVQQESNDYLRFEVENAVDGRLDGTTNFSGAVRIFRYVYKESETKQSIWVDGTEHASDASDDLDISTTLGPFFINANTAGSSDGTIRLYELLIVSGDISTTNITNMEDYLSDKYNISI